MGVIFENDKTIRPSDIFIQIGIGLSFLLFLFFISKFRFINEPLSQESYLITGGGLFIFFLYLIFTSKTVKRIEKLEKENKLIVTISRQLRSDRIIIINLTNVKLTLKTIPGRSLPRKKVLTISDNQKILKLSTQQKGITEVQLNQIINGIENTTHNIG